MAKKVEKKCHICVGCGRCGLSAENSLHVVTESFLKSDRLRRRNDLVRDDSVVAVDKDSRMTPDKAIREGDFVLADIGTTTIAMELYDAGGKKVAEYVCANPQRIFGADVISRIQAAENPMNSRQMQALIKKALEEGVEKFAVKTECISKMYVVGNTTMLYLLMGHDTAPLGCAPFQADYLQGESLQIGGVEAITLPGLSAFVGADVLAGVLACGMYDKEEINLLIDLGTNGELVLGNRNKMLACSTAAGPVFDGLCNKEGKTVWGADVIALVARLLENRVVDETGLLAEVYFDSGINIGGVHITQEVIRRLQTAKAAIAAGIECLTREYGVTDLRQVDRVYLAGGLGYFLKEEAAIKIGLLPAQFRGKVLAVGNFALAGGYAYHFLEKREEGAEKIVQRTTVINLAQWKDFGERFIQNMDFKEG